LSGYSIVVML